MAKARDQIMWQIGWAIWTYAALLLFQIIYG